MGIDYTLIASILVYVMVVRALGSGKLNVFWSSILATIGPFLLATILRYIMLTAYNVSLSQLVTLGGVVLVVVQLLVALFIFSRIQNEEESMGSYFGWSAAGLIALFFVVPFIMHNIFHS